MFDVGDPTRNAILQICFFGILALTIAALVPWKTFGAVRVSKLARWIVLPVLLLALVYESAMPTRFDIRVDLLLLLPMYVVVLLSTTLRWVRSRGDETPEVG